MDDKEIRIQVASDTEHEKVFAEIYVGDKFVALVSQERGLDDLMIEFPGPNLVEDQITREVSLEAFLEGVNLASKRLLGDG